MIIRFTASNFLSFKEETEFNMLTSDAKRHSHHVYNHQNVAILRAAAIYGANGAGKSNLIKAIGFLKNLALGENILTSYQQFKLTKELIDNPSELGIEFEMNGVIYAYGISFNYEQILNEWLYKVTVGRDDELIFERHTDENHVNKLHFSEKYLQTEKDKYFLEFYEKELLPPTASFISSTKNDHFEEIQLIKHWFEHKLVFVLPDFRPAEMFGSLFMQPDLRHLYSKMMALFDTGLQKIDFKKYTLEDANFSLVNTKKRESLERFFKENPKKIQIDTKSKSVHIYSYENEKIVISELIGFHGEGDNTVEFSLEEESDGTIRILDFLSIFFLLSIDDTVFIIDEIDQSIHPSLLKSFLKNLMDLTNTKGQIIFTTHESNLLDLDIFRQDEIWFAEKNKEGATQLYSLADFKPRYDLDIRKGYLNGRFGAIPFLGDLEKLNLTNHAQAK